MPCQTITIDFGVYKATLVYYYDEKNVTYTTIYHIVRLFIIILKKDSLIRQDRN